MKKILALVALSTLLITSCSGDQQFTASDTQIGPFTTTNTLAEAEKIFSNDSIVNRGSSIEVFEKGGAPLFIINSKEKDLGGIIHVLDPRYTTPEGINSASTFGDIKKAYTIKRIDNLLTTAVIFVEDSKAYFTIDKKHLPAELRFDLTKDIEVLQIPDTTPIKYFMLAW